MNVCSARLGGGREASWTDVRKSHVPRQANLLRRIHLRLAVTEREQGWAALAGGGARGPCDTQFLAEPNPLVFTHGVFERSGSPPAADSVVRHLPPLHWRIITSEKQGEAARALVSPDVLLRPRGLALYERTACGLERSPLMHRSKS
ncbi:Protein of unknown function [Gryllus bimaculatus]|nr:Protein of unknown function [Gryllus bimaculatus]